MNEKSIEERINDAISPLADMIEKLIDPVAAQQQEPAPPAEPQDKISQGVTDWIENKKTGGLGGKSLEGPTRFNANPKVKEPGPTHDNLGRLTGKEV